MDDSLARQACPSENPIGQRVKVDLAAGLPESNPEWMDVVGVGKHLRHAGVREDGRPQIYVPYWLWPVHGMNLVVRASGNPDLLAQAVREEVKELGSRRPVHRARSLESYVGQAMARSRFTVSIMVAFAAIALVLAVMGIYGVIAATVSRRTHELGVRIALGANVRDIVRMVLSQAATFLTLGAFLGLAGALALARFLDNLVFGVATTDPVTFAAAGCVIVTASLLACARPAWRGSKVEPVIALRHD